MTTLSSDNDVRNLVQTQLDKTIAWILQQLLPSAHLQWRPMLSLASEAKSIGSHVSISLPMLSPSQF